MGRIMKKLSAQLRKISTGPITLVALFILIMFMVLFIATLAPFFTLFKWLAVGASFVLLFVGLAVAVWMAVKRKSTGRKREPHL